MKYLCLAYYNEDSFNALPNNELQALVSKCSAHDRELHDTGQLLMVGSLASTGSSTSIRPQRGRSLVTDGPFVETVEQIGAFFLIEAEDLNDAIRVASKHPAARLGEQVGWGIEVRPIDSLQQPSSWNATG